jgi:hypothetical protein
MPITDFSATQTVELNAVRRSIPCAAAVHSPVALAVALAIETFRLLGKRATARSGRKRTWFKNLAFEGVEPIASFATAELLTVRIEAPKNVIFPTVVK